MRRLALVALLTLGALAPARADDALEQAVEAYFARPVAERTVADLTTAAPIYASLVAAGGGDAARKMVLEAWRRGERRTPRFAAFEARLVKAGEFAMPFTLERRGTKPDAGYPVFIAMHGGGGVPKEINDQQWGEMQRYYRCSDCIYVALRAPTDAWNGFYTDYVYPLVGEVLRGLAAFEDVDPERIYLLGYSHGGYGAFAIGPKMADRFAAIHADAAAPTDGETAAENLLNTRFTCLVGEHDDAYGRRERCLAFHAAVKKLRGDRTDVYPVVVEVAAGKHHPDLNDFDRPARMSGSFRTAAPRRLRWKLTDPVVSEFAWLQVSAPARGQEVVAAVKDNHVELTTTNVARLRVRLDERLVDRERPVTVVANGQEVFAGRVEPDLAVLCRTLAERGDPGLAFDREVALDLGAK